MSKREKIKKKINNYLFDHPVIKYILEYAFTFVMSVASAFIFAFGFRLFLSPINLAAGQYRIVSGGISGLSQNFTKLIIDIFHVTPISRANLQSILYFVINVPIMALAWFGIGKRFMAFSFVNVIAVSLFISIVPESWETLIVLDSDFSRAIFAGICTGISSALAFKADTSAGGLDVITYYFANRKSTAVGKYAVAFNMMIVLMYTILSIIEGGDVGQAAFTSLIYSIVYLFTTAMVVDAINQRNKKAQVQIITNKENMAKILISNFPHGCTIVKGKGAFSGEERIVLYMSVSTNEVRQVVKVVQAIDNHAFVNVISLQQVYGRFYIRPIK